MSTPKKLQLGIATLLTTYALLLALTPRHLSVQQTSAFAAPPQMVFPYLAKPRLWERWTVWSPQYDPGLLYTFGGPPVGPGMWLAWSGKQSGERKLTIATYQSPTTMTYGWEGWPGATPWRGSFYVDAGENFRTAVSATVTWQVDADLGWNPIARLSGPAAAKNLERDMAQSLQILRGQLEVEWLDKQRRRQEQLQRHIEQTAGSSE